MIWIDGLHCGTLCCPAAVMATHRDILTWRNFEGSKRMAHAPQFLRLVNESKKKVKETNVADVKRRMDAGEKFLLVDVREDNEWANGHIPGAIHLGEGVIERDIERQV